MAGEINWKLGINGLRETIAQLQVLNKELALAKNNANSIGNLGNIKAGASARSMPSIAPLVASNGLAQYIQSQKMDKHNNTLQKLINAGLINNPSTPLKAGPNAPISLQQSIQQSIHQAILGPTSLQKLQNKGLISLQKGSLNPIISTRQGGTAYGLEGPQALSSGLPPLPNFITNMFKHLNLKEGLHIAKPFAKMFGGKSSGLLREVGMLSKALGPLGIVVAGVVASLLALKKGVEEASEAYKTASKMGLNVQTSANINSAFKTIGMETPNLKRIAYQLGNGVNKDTNTIVGAAKSGMLGEQGQEILNNEKDFRKAMLDAADSSRQMSKASRAGFEISMNWNNLMRDVKVSFAQLAEDLAPLINGLIKFTDVIVQLTNKLYEKLLQTGGGILSSYPTGVLANLIFNNMIPKSSGEEQGGNNNKIYPFAESGYQAAQTTSLEKLGFVMAGPSSPEHSLNNISKHTQDMAATLHSIDSKLSNGDKKPSIPPSNSIHKIHMPFLA